jgi:large subunit ribosomal protein L32
MRHTRAHTNNRRSHHALDAVKSVKDKESGKRRLPHRIDESTGMYRGKQIAQPKRSAEKAPQARAPKLTETEHEHVHEHEPKTGGSKGIVGKLASAARPRSRSGMGGGA